MHPEMPENHNMVINATMPSGVEEWYCPICGRRLLLQWPPEFSYVLLEPGDDFANHSGGKGILSIASTEIFSEDDPAHQTDDELDRNPWKEWIERTDFENLWSDDIDGPQ